MLFQPSNIAPSTLSGIGIGTVDVTKGIDVSWQVNGDSPMTAYQITIYQNDTASTEMYTTGQISLDTPFQTHDVNGNPMFFSTSISAATLASAGIVNGYDNGYKIIIKQWWGPSDFVEQTSASVFITRTTPTLSIDAIPNPVTTNSATITATYAQAEGDPISTVEWIFALAGLEDTPIKQTGAIGTQILSFVADGLISGNTYSIMCNVVSASGMEVSTGFVQFPVSYPSSSIDVEYQVAQLKNSSATYLSWTGFGKNVLAYPYADSTKTTNGITFTVNGEGDISVSGTATADAHFTIASGTLSQLGFTVGQKLVVSIGSQIPSAFIEITETNSSNVVVSTITGSAPLQYVVPQTSNTISFDVVIPSGSSPSSEIQPMLFEESRIAAVNDLSVSMQPIQTLNGYDHPWPAGGGVNKLIECVPGTYTSTNLTAVVSDDGTITLSGTTGGSSEQVYIPLKQVMTVPNEQCYVHLLNQNINSAVAYNLELSSNTGGTNINSTVVPANKIFAVPSGRFGVQIDRVRFWVGANFDAALTMHPMITLSDSAQPFAPYSNICPISGRTGLNVWRTGKNVLVPSTIIDAYLNGADKLGASASDRTVIMRCIPNTTYTWTWNRDAIEGAGQDDTGALAFTSHPTINGETGTRMFVNSTVSGSSRTFTTGPNHNYLAIKIANVTKSNFESTLNSSQLELGSIATDHEPYKGNTISVDWTSEAGTVYGGTLDVVTGLLTVDRAMVDLGTLSASGWIYDSNRKGFTHSFTGPANANIICSAYPIGVYADWANASKTNLIFYVKPSRAIYLKTPDYTDGPSLSAALSGVQMVYELDTPLTYQLTPQEVTLLTQSNIWSDGGDVTVSYEKNDGTQAIKNGEIVSIDDSMAQNIPDPTFVPAISGVSIYRYSQGDPILHKVYDITDGTTTLLDYYVPSQNTVSYLIVAHTASNDLFALTNQFTPTFWAYSILLCSTDANGNYHVRQEYAFRYGVETGAVSNNNNPAIQQNFTRYPTRQPTNSQYKTGTLKGYIGTVSDQKLYTDSVSLQNAIYDISTSQLTKFLKTRKGETIMIDCAAQIQMQTGDNMREQPLVATIEWVEVGSSAESSIVSVPSDSFWPLS